MSRSGSGRLRAALLGLLLTVAVASLVASPSGGADREAGDRDSARTGSYFGLGGVYALEDFNRSFDDSAGINVRGGYRASPNMAFELTYEWLEGFDSTAGTPEVELDTHLITANARLFGLTGRFQPYALVGVGILIVNTELKLPDVPKPFEVEAGFTARFGGGVDFYLSEHKVLNPGCQLPVSLLVRIIHDPSSREGRECCSFAAFSLRPPRPTAQYAFAGLAFPASAPGLSSRVCRPWTRDSEEP
jgi:opacity protein-like surface antigen